MTGDPPVAVDLTGFRARMAIKKKGTDPDVLISIDSTADIWAPDSKTAIFFGNDGGAWYYRVYIRDNETLGLCSGLKDIDGVYDLFLENPYGETVLRQYGAANIKAAIRRTLA
ncbi:MAG: hypothetical protein AB1457_16330 [Chloroflexota bacterium]